MTDAKAIAEGLTEISDAAYRLYDTLEDARKGYHNNLDWYDDGPTDDGPTYQDLLENAFNDLTRRIEAARSVAAALEGRDG